MNYNIIVVPNALFPFKVTNSNCYTHG